MKKSDLNKIEQYLNNCNIHIVTVIKDKDAPFNLVCTDENDALRFVVVKKEKKSFKPFKKYRRTREEYEAFMKHYLAEHSEYSKGS